MRADIGAEDHEHWSEALSTRGDDVLRGLCHHVRVCLGSLEQCGLDQFELGSDSRLEHFVSRLFSQHPSSIYPHRQRMNSLACWARAKSGPGNTPKATVATTPTPTAANVVQPGRTTLVAMILGSAKNISTMTRM